MRPFLPGKSTPRLLTLAFLASAALAAYMAFASLVLRPLQAQGRGQGLLSTLCAFADLIDLPGKALLFGSGGRAVLDPRRRLVSRLLVDVVAYFFFVTALFFLFRRFGTEAKGLSLSRRVFLTRAFNKSSTRRTFSGEIFDS